MEESHEIFHVGEDQAVVIRMGAVQHRLMVDFLVFLHFGLCNMMAMTCQTIKIPLLVYLLFGPSTL